MHSFTQFRQDGGGYLYSVGYWQPPAYDTDRATWQPLRDCGSAEEAAGWVSYLNGGERPAGARW
jgi:hypothetical protein